MALQANSKTSRFRGEGSMYSKPLPMTPITYSFVVGTPALIGLAHKTVGSWGYKQALKPHLDLGFWPNEKPGNTRALYHRNVHHAYCTSLSETCSVSVYCATQDNQCIPK